MTPWRPATRPAAGGERRVSRVIYVVDYPFRLRDHVRFGIETLQVCGFDVEVWDLSPLILPNLESPKESLSPLTAEKHRLFASRRAVIAAVRRLTGADFVLCIGGGLDILESRSRSWGLEGRLASFGGDITLFTVGLRGTIRWGYF